MIFTDEQQNALDAKGRVLVSAAAGSGKTAVLVQRVADILCDSDNPIFADKILVVTFTNAAAAEMKSRIMQKINDKLRENPNNLHLKKQRILLNNAKICTIDSFCISLVQEYFYKLDLPAVFRTAEEGKLDDIAKNAVSATIEHYLDTRTDDLFSLLDILGGETAQKTLEKNILIINGYLNSLAFPQDYIESAIKLYENFDDNSIWLHTVFSKGREIASEQLSLLSDACDELENDELKDKYFDCFYNLKCYYDKLTDLLDNENISKIALTLQSYQKVKLGSSSGASDKAFVERMKKIRNTAEKNITVLCKMFSCTMAEYEHDAQTLFPMIKLLFEMVNDFRERMYAEKMKKALFSFSDTESLALSLLVKHENGRLMYTDIAKELSERFKCVMVDEYQDTNNLQDSIFNAVSDEGKNLFMVGDVKQSIYGFRKADPKIFLENRKKLSRYKQGSKASKVVMSGNFRSDKEICNAVNRTFLRIMSEKLGEMNYTKEDKLVPKTEFLPVDEKRVKLFVFEKHGNKDNTAVEAVKIANYINDTVGRKIINEDKALRAAKFSDIAILLRSRSHYADITAVFDEAGIPYWTDYDDNLLETREITTVCAMLNVINNPFYDVQLLTLLMSDMYSFSAEEIAKARLNNRKSSLYTAIYSDKNKSAQMIEFLNDIEFLRAAAANCSVDELIAQIYTRTSYANTVYLYANKNAHANLILFRSIAKEYEQNTGRGLNSFIRYINRLRDSGGSIATAKQTSENDDAVRIMTMHRSKGLQFPICILAGLGARFSSEDTNGSMLLSKNNGIGLKIVDNKRKIKYSSLAFEAAKIEIEHKLLAEQMRLLYVSMTRAKDFLIMTGSVKTPEQTIQNLNLSRYCDTNGRLSPAVVSQNASFLNWLILALGNYDDIERTIIDENSLDVACENVGENGEVEPDGEIVEQITKILDYRYPYAKINSVAAKQSASAIAHRESSYNYSFSALPLALQKQTLNAAQKGTAMHAFMQFCDFSAAANDLEADIERIKCEGKITDEQAKSLDRESLSAFLKSDTAKRICNAQSVYREKDFMVELAAKTVDSSLSDEFDGETIFIQGFVDLCFVEDGKLVIVDYKTDRVDDAKTLCERYAKQLEIYAVALEKVFGLSVAQTALYSFALDEYIPL